jgi:hypothetical protein
MTSIDDTRKEMRKYEQVRNDFYDFLDTNLEKNEHGQFDFSKQNPLDAQKVYEHFFKLDYQARKLRGLLMEAREIEPK